MTERKAEQYFISELKALGVTKYTVDSDGLYNISFNDNTYSISLENSIRDSIKLKTLEPIDMLINTIMKVGNQKDNYSLVKDNIFPTIEKSDIILDDEIQLPLTMQTKLCFYVFVDNQLIYIDVKDLAHWGIDQTTLEHVSSINLDSEYKSAKVSSKNLDGHNLYYFESSFPIKATLLLSKCFYLEYSETIGTDFYAVIPSRDFCFFFSSSDKEYFLKRIGRTVLDEYKKSGHPISTEVFLISQNKIEAIGSF